MRLAPERTIDEAQASLDVTGARVAHEHATTNSVRTFVIEPLADVTIATARQPLQYVALAAAIALAVAVANLLLLNLARGAERQAELAVREVLGAGPLRLRRQLLFEHLLVTCTGGVIALAAASAAVARLVASEAASLPRPDAIRIDGTAALVAAIVVLLVTMTLTLQPVSVRRASLQSGAREIGHTAGRSRRWLVASEVALALTLTTAGALFALSLARLLAIDVGFDSRGVVAARVSAYEAEYATRGDVVRFFDRVLEALTAIPDVQVAGGGSSLPFAGQTAGWHEVIGVVADVRHQALDEAPAPRVYDLFGQHWGRTLYVVARSRTGDAEPLINLARAQIAQRVTDLVRAIV